MNKKTEKLTFRTTAENEAFLKDIAELDERSVSSVISKMIGYFRSKGGARKTIRELNN